MSGERHRSSRDRLRTDDLPPPQHATVEGPRIALAPAHAEPELVVQPAAATPAPVAPAAGSHRVAPGETLYRIARAQGTTPEALAALNGIPVSAPLSVGQLLVLPAGSGAGAASGSSAPRGTLDPAGPEGLPPALAAAFEAAGTPAAVPASAAAVPPPEIGSAERAGSGGAHESHRPGRVESTVLGSLPPTALGPRAPATRKGSSPLQWPLRGVLYARFGRKGKSPHDGIDLAAPAGTPVRTAAEGSVLFAGPQQGYGLLVIVEHAHGLVTVYAHNRDLRVRTGQNVREGQVIATVGESGKTSGPHLHFEVRQDGAPVDPLDLLGPPPSS